VTIQATVKCWVIRLSILYVGGYAALRPGVLVDLLGLENLSNAFGFLFLFQGVGTAAGPPLAGLFHHVFLKLLRPFCTGREHCMCALISYIYVEMTNLSNSSSRVGFNVPPNTL